MKKLSLILALLFVSITFGYSQTGNQSTILCGTRIDYKNVSPYTEKIQIDSCKTNINYPWSYTVTWYQKNGYVMVKHFSESKYKCIMGKSSVKTCKKD